jgi:hypothetical protein
MMSRVCETSLLISTIASIWILFGRWFSETSQSYSIWLRLYYLFRTTDKAIAFTTLSCDRVSAAAMQIASSSLESEIPDFSEKSGI